MPSYIVYTNIDANPKVSKQYNYGGLDKTFKFVILVLPLNVSLL